MQGGNTAIFIAMIAYMALVIVIGLLYAKRNQNADQFYLGGRGLGPWVTAMSAEASDMSGWLLMGLPGLAYFTGAGEAVWTAVGLAVGTYLNWKLVSVRLRKYTEISENAITVPDFFANRFKDKSKTLMIIPALIILVFFTVYVATGFVSCGKLFASIFDLDYRMMMLISAAVIIVYTAVGGFLAESTTDFIQGILMCISLVVVLVVAVISIGGIGDMFAKLNETEGFFQLNRIVSGGLHTTAPSEPFGILKIFSALAWGLGYFGMPHVLLRFMAIRNTNELKKSRLVAVIWVVISLAAAVFIGFAGAVLYPTLLTTAPASETIFIELSTKLLPPVLAGIMMSGIMAATMSTSDSQLLITSSALSTNLFKGIFKKDATDKQVMWVSRIAIILVSIVAVFISLDENSNIFRLVSYAWAGFGAAFGPIILFSLFWKRTTKIGAICGMLAGGAMVPLWKHVISTLNPMFAIYELLPAFIFSCIVIVVVSLIDKAPSSEITEEFDKVMLAVKNKEA